MPSRRLSKTKHFWRNRMRFNSFQPLARIHRCRCPRSATRCMPGNLLMCDHTRGHESKENIRAILRLLIARACANTKEFPAQQRVASSAVGDGPTVPWKIAANTSYKVEPKLKSRPSIPWRDLPIFCAWSSGVYELCLIYFLQRHDLMNEAMIIHYRSRKQSKRRWGWHNLITRINNKILFSWNVP